MARQPLDAEVAEIEDMISICLPRRLKYWAALGDLTVLVGGMKYCFQHVG